MIFKLIFSDKTDFAQAKSQLDLLQNWSRECSDFDDIEEVIEISDEEAKKIMLRNSEFNQDLPEDDENFAEFSLYDASCGESFSIIGSTEWD